MFEKLRSVLLSQNFEVEPRLTKSYLRFPRHGKENAGWFTCQEIELSSGKKILKANYGDWRTGEKFSWRSDEIDALYSSQELQELLEKEKALQDTQEKEEKLLQQEAKKKAGYIYQQTAPASLTHSYLASKKIGSLPKNLIKYSEKTDSLVVPIVNPSGELCSLQFIDGSGSKKFLPGGQLDGCYCLLKGSKPEKVLLCEGLATGLSLTEHSQYSVVVAFNAQNLPKVATTLLGLQAEGKIPQSTEFVVAADNDFYTKGNPGLAKATQAAELLKTGIILPALHNEKNTDWNDLAQALPEEIKMILEREFALMNWVNNGLQPVEEKTPNHAPSVAEAGPGVRKEKQNETSQPAQSTLDSKYVNPPGTPRKFRFTDIAPLPLRVNKRGLPQLPLQQGVAAYVREYFAGDILKESADVFKWTGTHWTSWEPQSFKDFCINAVCRAAGPDASYDYARSVYGLILAGLPEVPQGMSLYKQVLQVCNFLDGTLWLNSRPGGHQELEFLPHRKQDYITWVLPYEYNAPREPNTVFREWLDRCFEGDPQKEEKISTLAQIGGACLIPVNPITGIFFGEAGTGKSTFAMLCERFVGPANASTVPLDRLSDQKMAEDLIGKRVNIDTELNQDKRIDGAMLKRITDRRGVVMNRMYKKSISAVLPAVHIYCGNVLPKGIDGTSSAMDRRLTIVEFINQINQEGMKLDYVSRILEAGAGDILGFFLDGLKQVIQNEGRYLNPGKLLLKEWKIENNAVAQFLVGIEENEVENLRLKEGSEIERKLLWESFQKFEPQKSKVYTRIGFYAQCRKIFREKTIKGVKYFEGIEAVGRGPGF